MGVDVDMDEGGGAWVRLTEYGYRCEYDIDMFACVWERQYVMERYGREDVCVDVKVCTTMCVDVTSRTVLLKGQTMCFGATGAETIGKCNEDSTGQYRLPDCAVRP